MRSPDDRAVPSPEADPLVPAYPAESPEEYPDDAADDERLWREVPPHH